MAHEIYRNKFMSYRKPAWHRLGTVFQDPLTASEAWEQMGPYDVVKAPLFAANQLTHDGNNMEVVVPVNGKFAVTGVFQKEQQQYHYGVVDTRYELATPKDLIGVWEMTVKANIETMGVLQHGKRFFFTTQMPGFDVKGDEHNLYLSIISPHGTGQALLMLLSPVRVVCANTAQMAISEAKAECRVPHMKGALNDVGIWLKDQWESASFKTQALKEALELLADRTTTDMMATSYIDKLVPVPEEDAEGYEKAVKTQDTIKALFAGEAVGSNTKAFDGTLFGLYNSVVEYADYHAKGGSAGAWGFGTGAKFKEKAFNLALDYAV